MIDILTGILSEGVLRGTLGEAKDASLTGYVQAFMAIDIATFLPLEVFCEGWMNWRPMSKGAMAEGFSEINVRGESWRRGPAGKGWDSGMKLLLGSRAWPTSWGFPVFRSAKNKKPNRTRMNTD
jgi:hypothetical protein